MNKERLLNVARALRESNPEHFDMNYQVQSECGTPACAFGHYAARQDLQDAFRVARSSWGNFSIHTTDGTDEGVWYDDDGVLKHFGITWHEAKELFSEHGCGGAETPTEAAAYIDNFVREHE